ncbi:anticodon-binding domain-containing protein [Blastocladiella britannica]|nr:anticodon-binding domain-containing protein [Blastocladiella britannica]
MEAKLARFGVGVDPSAQLLFDALAKTMSCRWHDATIVVMEQVLVDAPYTPSACRSKDARALERVRKVLQGERRKLRLGDE